VDNEVSLIGISFWRVNDMKDKHGIGIRVIGTLVTLVMFLVVCVASVPSIMYIGFKHLRYKIKL